MKVEKQLINSYEEAVDYIFNVPRFTKKNSMADTKAFLKKLGNPDHSLRIIHVAGTNGKGSVCAYMRSVLEAGGNRVAVFTSPHLVDVRERFVINGEMISREAFYEAFLRIYDLLEWEKIEAGEGYHPTFFEYMFFIAMLVFKEAEPDFCILETGLGGRLDATNAVAKKELAVITRIGLEHTEYLGDTLEAIAGEKAGIIAPDTPVVYWDTCEEVSSVFEKKAREMSAKSIPVSKYAYTFLRNNDKTIDFLYLYRYDISVIMRLHTIAGYQLENCALALRALEVLEDTYGSRIDMRHNMKRGVESCFWAGRMEEVLPNVFVDGAHNTDGVRAFVETVRRDGYDGRRRLLFSVVSDKDYSLMLRMLATEGLFESITFARLESYRGVSTEEMLKKLRQFSRVEVDGYEHVKDALEAVLKQKQEEERVYIVGSLYLVGEVKEYLSYD